MKSKKLLIILSTLALAIGLTSCNDAGVKDNKVYEVKENSKSKDIKKISESINTEGVDNFKNYSEVFNNNITSSENILLAVSKDKNLSYVMVPIKESNGAPIVIKGTPGFIKYSYIGAKVNLVQINNKTKEMKLIISEIPFVSTVKWNYDKTVVAFCGGERLTIYDTKANKLILKDELKNEPITYFGFAPDGRKICTEHENVINGSILYLDSNKISHSYENSNPLYYKGVLDNNYYYATKVEDNYSKYGKSYSKSSTMIIDKKETVKKELPIGRFRDSYKKALLQIGKNDFCLSYIKDINEEDKFKKITDEAIFDVKFIKDGKFIYTTANKDVVKNSFYLHLVNENGEEEQTLEISGGVIAITPNGEKAYVCGYNKEIINLNSFTVEKSINTEAGEEENIFKTLRGAMDVLYKYKINSVKDFESIKKYFVDTKNPDQCAYFDVTNILKESQRVSLSGVKYKIGLYSYNLKLYENDTKAIAQIIVSADNSSGSSLWSSLSMENSVALIKRDNRWYITGLSTFPYSKEYKLVKTKAESLISRLKVGNLPLENNIHKELKGKTIELGQIQFWQMSDPHLAPNVEYSNYCKVYLKVKENNKEIIYKMVLTKGYENESRWTLDVINKDRLHYLY